MPDELGDDVSNEGLADSESGSEQPDSTPVEGADQETAEVTPDSETFTVKVKGEEQQVTRDELINGYQRQSDYTKSKQELAAERQELQQAEKVWAALRSDPVGTMKALEEHFADVLAAEGESEELDPEEKRLREVESFMKSQRERETQREIQDEIKRLQGEFGEFDGKELLEFAVEKNIPDLEAALLKKQRVDGPKKGQSDEEVAEAKRKTAAVHSGGRSGDATSKGPQKIETLEDAFAAAKEELKG